ncbi:hypothetical protein DPMN_020343 [Dreissena polymorpha]|uniref:Uncharacterized protein n=1 Tax=Dreissena polymorpha TaxID=45954 RepID=A0A9D4NKW1_DREPO|nr:hypothetical protein DPMN_020343 [Dreissena polymorpha]
MPGALLHNLLANKSQSWQPSNEESWRFFKEDTRHDSLCKNVLDRGRRRGRAKK